MVNGRITPNMELKEILVTMSDGAPGAAVCLAEMMNFNSKIALYNIVWFDSMEIYGSTIYRLWNGCCNRDMTEFNDAIQFLRSNNFSKEQIHEKIASGDIFSFI
ncbi:MAG TPA: hypothetical protein DCZ30_06850 [Clostridiales bacterium]|nr:hypothetical protein [Clostridiales bacterium]